MLNRLKQLGVRISLDDFGTGFSSLGQLRQLPIDEIKIDQSFVRDINDDTYAATLCRAIIAMSQQLRYTVVAEGVETAAQARFLNEAGCHSLQGFLFSQAVPASVLGQWLVEDTRWGLDGAVRTGRDGAGPARANDH
jgi:EAL domain-containing protein (putative c-di-GMP-specific phosphodiesterase class I)